MFCYSGDQEEEEEGEVEGEVAGVWNTLGSLKRRMTMLEMLVCHVSLMVTIGLAQSTM